MKFPILTTTLALATIAQYMIFGTIPQELLWSANFREAMVPTWQWTTTHFIHLSRSHLFWNVLALVILGGIIEQHSKRRLILALGFGIISVNCYLLWLFSLPAYAGLSGALNTLFVVALYQLYQNSNYKTAAQISFILAMLKLIYEGFTTNSVFHMLAWPPVIEAHLAGFIGGILFCAILNLTQQKFEASWPEQHKLLTP